MRIFPLIAVLALVVIAGNQYGSQPSTDTRRMDNIRPQSGSLYERRMPPTRSDSAERYERRGALTYRNGSAFGFHEFRTLPNGMQVGKLGALKYLLRDGKPITPGFHTIEPFKDGYVATLGAAMFILDADGRIINKSGIRPRRHPIDRPDQGRSPFIYMVKWYQVLFPQNI